MASFKDAGSSLLLDNALKRRRCWLEVFNLRVTGAVYLRAQERVKWVKITAKESLQKFLAFFHKTSAPEYEIGKHILNIHLNLYKNIDIINMLDGSSTIKWRESHEIVLEQGRTLDKSSTSMQFLTLAASWDASWFSHLLLQMVPWRTGAMWFL